MRFGGTLTLEDAFALGFDHVALCMGAGKPTVLDLPNGLARGVRTASDFLMALQLTGAAKADSIANMQLRLPVVVIGGGLTAIDTATESLAYYPVQVEKFLARYETLAAEAASDAVRDGWDDEEREIAEEFLAHARAIRAERAAAAREGARAAHRRTAAALGRRRPSPTAGGSIDSPSYTLNHEEVEKALEEGIRFAEGLTPLAVEVDDYGARQRLRVSRCSARRRTAVARSRRDTGCRRARSWSPRARSPTPCSRARTRRTSSSTASTSRPARRDGAPVKPAYAPVPSRRSAEVLLSRHRATAARSASSATCIRRIFGNVVKAMGSAKQGYPVVSRVLARVAPAIAGERRGRSSRASTDDLRATVQRVERLTPDDRRGGGARARGGAAFRARPVLPAAELRDAGAAWSAARGCTMEGLALTGAWVDREQGLVSTIVLEMGGSSRPVRTAAAGRAGRADGADRHADRDRRRARP